MRGGSTVLDSFLFSPLLPHNTLMHHSNAQKKKKERERERERETKEKKKTVVFLFCFFYHTGEDLRRDP